MLNRRSFLVAGATAVLGTASAHANIFTDTIDAIRGHIDDVEDRINHDDEFVDGNTLAMGEFRKDDIGRDLIHWANGTVSLKQLNDMYYIQLHEDFESGPAPDLYIYTSINKVVDEKTFSMAETRELFKLKSGSGAQVYIVDKLFVDQEHREVIIWCKRFGAFIAAVSL